MISFCHGNIVVIMAKLEEKLSENLTNYLPSMLEEDKPQKFYVTKLLQYLFNIFEWRNSITGYKIDTELNELSGFEDRRFKVERKALMNEYMLSLIEKIIGSGSNEIEKLKKLIRDTYITDKLTIQLSCY